MEVFRLFGFLIGGVGREFPESYRESVIEIILTIHEAWINEFFKAMEID